ncbi:MAG: hypothetical protein RLP12_07630 [Ekhidna sp.]
MSIGYKSLKSISAISLPIAICVIAIAIDWKLTEPVALPPLLNGSMSEAKSKALDIIISRSNLIANWNVAIIGAALYCLINNRKIPALSMFNVSIAICLASSVTSIYFSQLAMDVVSRSLIIEQDFFYNKNLDKALIAQHISSLISVSSLCVGGIVMKEIR